MPRGGEHVTVVGMDFPKPILLGVGEMERIDGPQENLGGEFFIPPAGRLDDLRVGIDPCPVPRGA